MTGAPPEAPLPSDTLERLPDDFWNAPTGGDEAADGTAPPAPHAAPSDAPSAPPQRGAASDEPRRRPGDSGVATLQRLFPGRVSSVEPHALDVAGADDDGAAPTTVATGAPDDPPDEPPAQGGLESDRSRR